MWRRLGQSRAAWLAGLALLVGLQAARLYTQASLETQTVDEGIHLSSGYTFLKTGEYSLDKEHPPLARLMCAVPLWLIGVDPRLDAQTWRDKWMMDHGKAIIWQQKGIAPETVMLAARCGTIVLALLLSLSVALWTRSRFGIGAGWLAAALVTLEPNLNAHGHLVTTDLGAALTVFLAVIAFDRLVRTGACADALWAGLALGAAAATKFSTLFLVPAFVVVWVVARRPWRELGTRCVPVALIAVLVVLASYGPASLVPADAAPLEDQVEEGGALNTTLRYVGKHWGVRAHPYLVGLGLLGAHQTTGHPAFLMGEVYQGGKWEFFPVAFLAKTPLGALLLILIALPLLRKAPIAEWRAIIVPLVLLWGLAVTAGINIGLRHILPVYPLTYALAAGLYGKYGEPAYARTFAAAGGLAIALLAYESGRMAGRDLAFFNLAAGGPERGGQMLVDSNIDWGQSLGELRRWLGTRKPADVCLVYFGTAPIAYYGFNECAITPTEEIRKGYKLERRYAAISVTLLQGVYHKREWYTWLRERKPAARVGESIYVYDVEDLMR